MLRISNEALTFDDVLLVPGYSDVTAKDVTTHTQLTREITMNIPLISAAMDTVTESRLAIAIAQEGGVGIVHKSMSIEDQAREVWAVKKYESGVVKDPFTIESSATLEQLRALTEANNISGVPILENGNLVGIVTRRDVRFASDMRASVTSVMTPKEKLVTVKEGAGADEVRALLHKHRIEKVLVINDDFELKGLITVTDIDKAEQYPNACKDDQGRLIVGASVSVGDGTDDRIAALVHANVDVLVVDTAHGHSHGVLHTVAQIREKAGPNAQIIAGNVATGAAAEALISAGANAIKVGIGPGSICTTRIVSGVGVPQLTAVQNVVSVCKKAKIPVIADGGIKFSGDIAKAIAAGADCVMVGSVLAGTDEAPGEVILYQGRSYKVYRGMGSVGAMSKGAHDRYFQSEQGDTSKYVPEGIEGRVPARGPVENVIHQLTGGLRSSMGYTGNPDISSMRDNCNFVRITNAGLSESHVHDVEITREAPNYRR